MSGAARSENIFRKVALERLSSPEQLDRLITVTSPTGWLAALALATLLAIFLAWTVFGTVPTRIQGAGILVARGGQVYDAMAPAAGALATIAVVGSAVAKGDVLATLDATQTAQDLAHAGDVLREREAELAQTIQRYEREITLRRRNNEAQKSNLLNIAETAERRRIFYTQELGCSETVAAKGFLTPRAVQDTRQRMEQAEQEAQRAQSDILRLEADELELISRRDKEVAAAQDATSAARRRVEELAILQERGTKIVSPGAGRVTEVKATVGAVVAAGRPLLSVESAGDGLELILYLPNEHGKKVFADMEVRIEPATVKKEEFGTLIGRILTVSDFPVTPEGMLSVLQNPQLVRDFSGRGAPYAARVELKLSPGSPTGYAWSGGGGPQLQLSSGTTAAAEVTVRRQSPASLLLPILRERTGVAW